jgi:hypothetical protein
MAAFCIYSNRVCPDRSKSRPSAKGTASTAFGYRFPSLKNDTTDVFFAISQAQPVSSSSSPLLGSRRRARSRLCVAAAALRTPREDGVHLVAFHPRHRFRERDFGQLPDQTFQDPPADFRMRHLASPEEDGRLHLVPVLEEALDVLLLELVIVFGDLRPELGSPLTSITFGASASRARFCS